MGPKELGRVMADMEWDAGDFGCVGPEGVVPLPGEWKRGTISVGALAACGMTDDVMPVVEEAAAARWDELRELYGRAARTGGEVGSGAE